MGTPSQRHGELLAILGEDGLRQALAPIEEPSGLPGAAYWSGEWFALENARIFSRHWVFACAEAEIARAGCQKPVAVAGADLLLVRDRAMRVRAFHNVCRHRGTRLVAAPCSGPVITCPYHAWTYRLDGSLKTRPHFLGADRHEEVSAESGLGLGEVRCASWNGCVFVNLDGGARPLDAWLAPMVERARAFDLSLIRWIGKEEFRVRSNWKLVLENWMEGYHVFAAHPRLLDHAPMSVRSSGAWSDDVFHNGYVAPRATPGRGEGALPTFPGLDDEHRRSGLWFTCFPSFSVEIYADQFVVFAVWPLAPDETLEEFHFFVVGDAAARDGRHAEGREQLVAMWRDLNGEDIRLVEELQAGRRSPAFEGSWMSPAWEVPAHQFCSRIVDAMA